MKAQTSRRFLIHAPGGGSGHATRAGRLAEALTTRGASVRVLVAQGRRVLIDPELDVRELPRLRSVEELSRRVQSELDEFQAEHLVVDALPDGVLGEVRDRSRELERTLLLRLHRSLPSLRGYDRVIAYLVHHEHPNRRIVNARHGAS